MPAATSHVLRNEHFVRGSHGAAVRPSRGRQLVVAASSAGSPPPRPSYSVSLFDALKFNGPAPELVNCRLAMVGFVNAAIHEVTHGDTVLQQAQQLDAATVLLLVAWVVATLVPICKGVKNNEAFGPFSPHAELVNGRAAALGFVALMALEYKAGVPFF